MPVAPWQSTSTLPRLAYPPACAPPPPPIVLLPHQTVRSAARPTPAHRPRAQSPSQTRGCRNEKKKLGVSNTPYDGGRWITDGGWWVTDGGWWVTDGGWWITDGGWSVNRWRLVCNRWRLVCN